MPWDYPTHLGPFHLSFAPPLLLYTHRPMNRQHWICICVCVQPSTRVSTIYIKDVGMWNGLSRHTVPSAELLALDARARALAPSQDYTHSGFGCSSRRSLSCILPGDFFFFFTSLPYHHSTSLALVIHQLVVMVWSCLLSRGRVRGSRVARHRLDLAGSLRI